VTTATAPIAAMPAVFFGHGSPMNTLEHNRYTEAWRRIGETVPPPRAILMVSAHWCTRGTRVTAMAHPRTIHDFGGFPRELFEVQYPAAGDPALAERVGKLLANGVQADHDWGLDHGAWSVLAHAWPRAEVPVVQLSLDLALPPASHYELAQRLAPLRADGVLIAGSGNVVHNLARMQWIESATPYDWAERFNGWVRERLAAGDHAALCGYAAQGADARLSAPTPEHYLPLLYVIAQQQAGERVTLPVDGIEYGSIGMLSAVVGTPG